MSLTSTLFDGLETLTEIPGGPYVAAGISAVAGGSLIALVWRSLNPYPVHERRYRPTLVGRRPGRIPLEKIAVSQSPLDIPLDVVPRDEVTGRTPYDIVGPDAIRVVVDQFYSAVCADPDLSGFFTGVDIERVKRHQTLLIGQLWGGPVAFPLKALADAHAHLGITPESYWKVVGHLMVTLTRAGVADWISIFTMTRLYQARNLIISAGNPLDPETPPAPDPETHEFTPAVPGGELCVCDADELAPVHYSPAPARGPEDTADADATGGQP